MPLHHESAFETEICEYLGAHGWLYAEGDAAGYDWARALFPADVIAWVQANQPKACVVASSPDLTGFRNLSGLSRSDRQDHIA